MKRIEEIRLENFADIAKIKEDANSYATSNKTDVCKRFFLIGKETISKFEEVYGKIFGDYRITDADEKISGLKIQGRTKVILVVDIKYYVDKRDFASEMCENGCFYDAHLSKVVEYNGVMMYAYSSRGHKGYTFYLFNDCTDLSQVEYEKPNRVGTLTDKKMEEWLNALLEEKRIALNVKNENELKVKQFKNMLADLLKMPLSKFEENSNVFRMGIFEIKYQCNNKTGYTRVDVDFDICARNADNKTYLTNVDRIKILANAGLLK